jgi:hypothetical protein
LAAIPANWHDSGRVHLQKQPVPYKHNESRRHKFSKPKYKVTNWTEYNAALRRRGDITIWFTEAAINEWRPAKTGARGRPQEYSDHAIETAILIRQVFHLLLRQTEDFMVSLARLMNAAISIPDFSSISKRSIELPRHVLSKALEPGSLVIVDSTGLKVYGQDEWHQEKHGVPARRTWRKLHLAVDEKHQILACELTTPEVGDPTAVPDLLAQINTPFEVFMGDGAYDGEPVSRAVLAKQPSARLSCHRTNQQSIRKPVTPSAMSTSEPLKSMGESPGRKTMTTAYAVELSWPFSATSASLTAA